MPTKAADKTPTQTQEVEEGQADDGKLVNCYYQVFFSAGSLPCKGSSRVIKWCVSICGVTQRNKRVISSELHLYLVTIEITLQGR